MLSKPFPEPFEEGRAHAMPGGEADGIEIIRHRRFMRAKQGVGRCIAHRQRRQHALRLRRGEITREPACRGRFHARRATLHIVLSLEMAARGVGEPGGMDDGELAVIIEALQGLQPLMQPEIDIGDRLLKGKAGLITLPLNPQRAVPGRHIILVGTGRNERQPIRAAAQEDDHKHLVGHLALLAQHELR